jgi:predicted  nucleic acid-binding Zn-ribbon protein
MTTIDDVIRLMNKFASERDSDISALRDAVNTLNESNRFKQQKILDQDDMISDLGNKIGILTAQKVTLEGEIARLQELIPPDA